MQTQTLCQELGSRKMNLHGISGFVRRATRLIKVYKKKKWSLERIEGEGKEREKEKKKRKKKGRKKNNDQQLRLGYL